MIVETTALCTAQATAYAAAMGDFKMHVFGGTPPATAAALAGALGTPIVTFQANEADGGGKYGIKWGTAANGQIGRLEGQAASGTAASTADGTYVVMANVDDTLGADSTKKRKLFSIGTSGTDVVVGTTHFVTGGNYPFPTDFGMSWNAPTL